MQRASKLEPREIQWLLPGQIGKRIPFGMIGLIGSRPGQGKSSFGNYLTAQATRQGMPVILSNQEDAVHEVLVPRLIAAGAHMPRVFLPEEPIVLPNDLGKLEKLIKQTRSRLFIADTAAQHFSCGLSSDQEIRQALTPLRKILEREQVACLFVVHTKMGHFSHPLDAFFGGSAGLKGAARVVYVFGPDPKNPTNRVLMPVKSNIGPIDEGTEFESEIVQIQHGLTKAKKPKLHDVIVLKPASLKATANAMQMIRFSGAKPKSGVDEGTNPTRLAMTKEWLTGMLRKGPKKHADLLAEAKKVGISQMTLTRAGAELHVEKKFGGPKNGWTWDLPEKHPLRKRREAKQRLGEATGTTPPKAKSKEDLDQALTDLLAGTTAAASKSKKA